MTDAVLTSILRATLVSIILFIVTMVYNVNLSIEFYALFWGLCALLIERGR